MVLWYTNGNTCIRSHDLDLIERALTQILEQEGHRRIPQPPLPENSSPVLSKILSDSWEVTSYLWTIGLFAENLGWTIIKTVPPQLLCQRASCATRVRLSELARQTSCDAFHYRVYDGYSGTLLEANAAGETFVSGYIDSDDMSNMQFYDEPINKLSGGLKFFLLDVPEEMQAAGRIHIDYEARERKRKELNVLLSQKQKQEINTESEWEELLKLESELSELDKFSFEIADEALWRILARTKHYWGYNYRPNLLYQAYTKPKELEADGARLLYFQLAGKPDITEIFEQFSHESEIDIVDRMRQAGWISVSDSSGEEDNF